MEATSGCDLLLAAACVRDAGRRTGQIDLPPELARTPLKALTGSEPEDILTRDFGPDASSTISKKDLMPRVSVVLVFLRNIRPESLLDAGSGRGAFFPFRQEFSDTPVTSLDVLERPHGTAGSCQQRRSLAAQPQPVDRTAEGAGLS